MSPASREREQAAQLRPWVDQVTRLIARRLRAARSHAAAGLMPDANDSLDELTDDLLSRLRVARQTFYTTAFPAQWSVLDPEIVDPDEQPTAHGLERAASEPILNANQAADLSGQVETARQELMLTPVAYPDRSAMPSSVFGNWEARHRGLITAGATVALSNAQIALYEAVGRLLIKAELR